MTSFHYPRGAYDDPDQLLSLIGSFWHNVYQGNDLVGDLLFSRAQRDMQSHLDMLELVAATSRFDVPVFHTENWRLLTFKQSEVNSANVLETYRESTSRVYTEDSNLQYDVPPSGLDTYTVSAPAELTDCPLILNRIAAPSVTLVRGVDYWLPGPGLLTFRQDPFTLELATREILQGSVVTDYEAAIWLFRGKYDWNTVYRQFGYALRLRLASSEGYKQLVNAFLDAMTQGTRVRDMHYAWAAVTGIPLVWEDTEVVEAIREDRRGLVIVTDRHAYRFPEGSTAVVAVGDAVHGGDSLVDALVFHEFTRGTVPESLTALALGRGFLAAGYLGDLVFENKTVPLTVETVDGYTKVSFELGGFPADVEAFWDEVHRRGIEQGQTLAHLLDVRANPVGEPTAAMLPTTVNPLEFLAANLLRYHCFVVQVRSQLLGPAKLGLHAVSGMRRIIPPHTAMLVVVELAHTDAAVIMEGPGDATKPGYEETVSGFPCMTANESLNGPDMIRERVILRQLRGQCE